MRTISCQERVPHAVERISYHSLDTEPDSYEESSRQDRQETVREFARSDFQVGYLRTELEIARSTDEKNIIGDALGQVIDDVRFQGSLL